VYRVLGTDGNEYGPVSAEVLHQWIAEGRACAKTSVQLEGGADWQPLGSVPEFTDALAAMPAGPIVQTAPPEVRTSDLAIGSLMLGVVGACGITGLAGLILGIISLSKIKGSGGRLRGRGLAIAGIWTSSVMLLLGVPFMAGVALPMWAKARAPEQTIYCRINMQQLGLAATLYAQSHKGQLPPSATWCDALQGETQWPEIFQCPSERRRRCSYAFNAQLSGKKQTEINPNTVVFFESNLGWNGSGGPEALKPHRHSLHRVNVLLANGTVATVSRSKLDTLRWEP
jgi:Domain of unknown function (DUF4190)/GYF domain 2